MHDFRRLRVWQMAREFAAGVDLATRRFPRRDHGVIGGQLRRAALSIPANVAEGCGKSSRKETIRFLQIACGSARESENHIIIATDLGYLTNAVGDDLLATAGSIRRMLARLMTALSDQRT